ncbi:MAG: universal stress protein [Candidatus Thermoplasmatota archaeon]|nr:universal stress protein [Candidatus Thermoplasmatota archaeon]
MKKSKECKVGNEELVFKDILVPISSEYFTIDLIERAGVLAEHFSAHLSFVYILESEILDFMERKTDSYRTTQDMAEVKEELLREQHEIGNKVILTEIEKVLKQKNVSFDFNILPGVFSRIVKDEVDHGNFDLVLMSYKKYCFVNYSVLDEIDIPLWVECGNNRKSLLAICSNLYANKKIFEISLLLSKMFHWDLEMVYVVDVHADSTGSDDVRRRKNHSELMNDGDAFVSALKEQGINIHLVEGDIKHETLKAAKTVEPKLVVIGRGHKKDFLGFPVKHFQQRLVEKCKYSFLFIK